MSIECKTFRSNFFKRKTMEEHQEQEQESRRPLQEDRDEDNLEWKSA